MPWAASWLSGPSYGGRNWERGMAWGRLAGAAQRHLWAWMAGEDRDPDTGMSHLDHALTNLAFLVAYEERGIGTDDRAKPYLDAGASNIEPDEIATAHDQQPLQTKGLAAVLDVVTAKALREEGGR